MRTVYTTPQVRSDLREIADYISLNSQMAAERFLKAADATFQQLTKNPELGSTDEFQLASLIGIRRWRIRRFKRYLVFYRVHATTVEIVRVFHGSRDIESLFPP